MVYIITIVKYQVLIGFFKVDFFTVDGHDVLPIPVAPSAVHSASSIVRSWSSSGSSFSLIPGPLLSRTSSRTLIQTLASTDTFLAPASGLDPTIPLRHLLDIINRHRSLQEAHIVRVDAYRRFNGQVVHRFIILELERENRQKIWLRIDRKREKGKILKFLAERGSGLANDRVSFCLLFRVYSNPSSCRLGYRQINKSFLKA